MENILFGIYIILVSCLLFIIYGIITQYEQYHDINLDKLVLSPYQEISYKKKVL